MFLLLALLSLGASAQLVRKCCPNRMSLVIGGSTISCSPSAHHWEHDGLRFGLPAGCHIAQAEQMYLVQLGDTVSCIDNLNGTEAIVAVKCPVDRHYFQIPDIHYLPKCCSSDRVYDSVLQTCWGQQRNFSYEFYLDWLVRETSGIVDLRIGVPPCPGDQVVVDHLVTYDKIHRGKNGAISFFHRGIETVMNPDELCVDQTERRDVWIVRACEDFRLACQENTCIRKCCPEGMSFNFTKSCVETHVNIHPLTVYNISEDTLVPVEARATAYWYDLKCDKYRDYPESEYTLAVDGSIYSIQEGMWTETGEFCVEHVVDDFFNDTFLFFCFFDEEEPQINLWATVGMLVSCFFLFLTLLVYAIVPSLKNLHGKTLMCHISCLLVGYSCLSTVQLVTNQLWNQACVILGYVNFFSLLAAFFWLNVISFDIWWTFGSMRPMMDRKKREWRRFLLYSAYAWLSTTFITLFAGLNDYLLFLPTYLTARIGQDSCWFTPRTSSVFVFFNGPVGVLLTVNLVLFVLTTRHCSKVKSDLDKVGHTPIADNKFKSDKTRLKMNCKLFVAMGINWFLEFLSAVNYKMQFIPIQIWYLSDMANACVGLVIFCIFVLKKRVIRELKRKLEEMLFCVRAPPRQPSVSTLFSTNNTMSTDLSSHVMKKSISESRLSPLPLVKHNPALKSQPKSKSTNRLFV